MLGQSDAMIFVNLHPQDLLDEQLYDRTAPLSAMAKRVVLEITVEEAYLHCAKALMRAQLWNPDVRQERSALPPTRTILSDHTGVAQPPETQAEMVARYAPDL